MQKISPVWPRLALLDLAWPCLASLGPAGPRLVLLSYFSILISTYQFARPNQKRDVMQNFWRAVSAARSKLGLCLVDESQALRDVARVLTNPKSESHSTPWPRSARKF